MFYLSWVFVFKSVDEVSGIRWSKHLKYEISFIILISLNDNVESQSLGRSKC